MTVIHKYRFLGAFIAILLLFLVLAAFLLSHQQQSLLRAEAYQQAQRDLELAAEASLENLQKADFASVRSFLKRWGENHSDYHEVRALFPNGYVLLDYRSSRPVDPEFYSFSNEVALGDRKLATLSLVGDYHEKDRIAGRLRSSLLAGAGIVTLLLGAAVWFVIRRLGMMPLEDAVRERTQALQIAKEELEHYQNDLENLVAERTAALKETELRYRTVADFTYDWETWIGSDGRWIYCSPSCLRISGRRADEFINKPELFLEIIHPDDRPFMQSHLDCCIRPDGGLEAAFQFRISMPDGSARWLEHVCVPVYDEAGRYIGRRATNRDITERRRSEEELLRKEKLATLGRLAGSVGHELRNPLGVMSNAVYYLQMVLGNSDQTVRDYLAMIKSEIAASERIVSDLLDAVRTKPPQPQHLSAGELIGMSLQRYVVPDSVRLEVEARAVRTVLADPFQIKQVFINLISNALDAMPDGGVLSIVAEDDGEKGVRVLFRDTGKGIAPEHRASLFQPLFTTKARGIGLGLVVVKNLVEANGGSVAVESAPGAGTTFTVVLPAGM